MTKYGKPHLWQHNVVLCLTPWKAELVWIGRWLSECIEKIFFSIHSGWLLYRSRSPIPVLTGLDVGQQFADRDQLATATLNLHRRRADFGQAICLTGSVSAIHGTFLSVPVQLQPVIRLSSYAICHECNMGPASRTL